MASFSNTNICLTDTVLLLGKEQNALMSSLAVLTQNYGIYFSFSCRNWDIRQVMKNMFARPKTYFNLFYFKPCFYCLFWCLIKMILRKKLPKICVRKSKSLTTVPPVGFCRPKPIRSVWSGSAVSNSFLISKKTSRGNLI